MKTLLFMTLAAALPAMAQSPIYKHVDETGKVTYTNQPLKGAVRIELEPLSTVQLKAGSAQARLTEAASANGAKSKDLPVPATSAAASDDPERPQLEVKRLTPPAQAAPGAVAAQQQAADSARPTERGERSERERRLIEMIEEHERVLRALRAELANLK